MKTGGEKYASSQASWALISHGVTEARVETHRIRHLLYRLSKVSEEPGVREFISKNFGDAIAALPDRIQALEIALDRTMYALAKLGEDHLRNRLPISDRAVVEEGIVGGKPFGGGLHRQSIIRVIDQYHQQLIDQAALKSVGEKLTRLANGDPVVALIIENTRKMFAALDDLDYRVRVCRAKEAEPQLQDLSRVLRRARAVLPL